MGAPRIANQPPGGPHTRRAMPCRAGLAPPAISTKLVLVQEGTLMLRMSRLTDYATVLLAALAGEPGRVQTAASLAEQTRIAAPTVCKLLKQLQRAGLVISTRGLHGGYQLARPAAQISAAAIIDALEGPVALTDCSAGHGNCEIEDTCRVGRVWQRLNLAIRRALYDVSLAQLAGLDAAPARLPALARALEAAPARAPARPARGETMSESARELESLVARGYQHGFVTEIDADTVAPGLNEDVVRLISRKKQEPAFLTEWRLKALRHWLTMREPHWGHVRFAPIDYQAISYYSAPRAKKDGPKSLDEVDPKLLETYEKLGVPLHERARLAGVAVDAVFDSVSVATTFRERLAAAGVVFCPFSEAVRTHQQLIEQYLGSVVPYTDNFFATLNSAVFSDGSFVYVPKGVRCPMELSTYFRINASSTGQFERTLIIADEGSYVSYLE